MALPFAFFYLPTPNLEGSLHWYRDILGHDELWREGADTVGLAVPGSDIGLMLDRVADAADGGPGPMFIADDVDGFLAEHPDVKPVTDPVSIPDGKLASFRDPAGNWFYVLDQSQAD
jgi:catechol 2,3-dioxygenase-like lactoylglutathione lyase family enzyme